MLKCFRQSARPLFSARPGQHRPAGLIALAVLHLGPFSTSAGALSVRTGPERLGPEGAFAVGPLGPGRRAGPASRSEGGGLGEQAGRHSLQPASRLAAGCVP